jgi:hypothetical protein
MLSSASSSSITTSPASTLSAQADDTLQCSSTETSLSRQEISPPANNDWYQDRSYTDDSMKENLDYPELPQSIVSSVEYSVHEANSMLVEKNFSNDENMYFDMRYRPRENSSIVNNVSIESSYIHQHLDEMDNDQLDDDVFVCESATSSVCLPPPDATDAWEELAESASCGSSTALFQESTHSAFSSNVMSDNLSTFQVSDRDMR